MRQCSPLDVGNRKLSELSPDTPKVPSLTQQQLSGTVPRGQLSETVAYPLGNEGGQKKRGPREEIGDRSGSLSSLFSSLKCSFVPGYQERRRSQTTASSLPLSPAADRELRLSLRTILPRGRWGLRCTRRWRTVNPQKQDGFSRRLSGTCPFKGYKPSQSSDSLPKPLSPINYTMWKEKKKERNLWTVKNNTGVWCLACQLVKQSGALPPRRVFWELRYTHQPAQEVKG